MLVFNLVAVLVLEYLGKAVLNLVQVCEYMYSCSVHLHIHVDTRSSRPEYLLGRCDYM